MRNFDLTSLDIIYYPVSAILWFWHKVFGTVLGEASGFAWALSVIFLVFTLRALLYKPFVNQVRTQRQMQEFQPQIKALQKKYSGDKQRLALEMQKLQKEHGFNPIAGCLPVLVQAPVFIGLFHVLRSFNRTGDGIGQLGLSIEENASLPNYVFGVGDVQSFLDAKLFGAPLSASISSTADQLLAFGTDISKPSIVTVAVPLMIIASVATHFTARMSISRQSAAAAANPQAAIMNKLVLWVFPIGVLAFGAFLPLAVLLYWLANNAWTLGQQHIVYSGIAKEDEAKQLLAEERRAASAPKPGARPTKAKKSAPKGGTGLSLEKASVDDVDPAESTVTDDAGAEPGSVNPPRGRSAASRSARTSRPHTGGSGQSGSGRPRTTSGRGSRKKR